MNEVWVVKVEYKDVRDAGAVFGPYTEKSAWRAVDRVQQEILQATDRHEFNHHPTGVAFAWAEPLERYEEFLSPRQLRDLRRLVREEDKQQDPRQER